MERNSRKLIQLLEQDGFRLIGTHSWIYWEQDLAKAWPTISRGL